MNHKDYVIERFKNFDETQIIITDHAQEQALFRNIPLAEIRQNILNPEKLVFAGRQQSQKDEEKFDCYFAYSRTRCHRYIVVINDKCIICTVIKINRRWQKMVEKYL